METPLPLVSVIVPTYNRPHYHQRLYRSFCHQQYANKQLVVLDDSPKASAFLSTVCDERVHYLWQPERLSIGEKRNQLIERSNGDIIAHFDDDDFYSPHYLTTMVRALKNEPGSENALVKLSSWFTFSEQHQRFFYWDTAQQDSFHITVESGGALHSVDAASQFSPSFVDDNLWGYGFSYVYQKSLYPSIAFNPEDNWGEDIRFLHKVGQAGHACQALPDTQGLVMHIIHSSNTSRIFPQYHLPPFMIQQLFPPELGNHLAPSSSPDKKPGYK